MRGIFCGTAAKTNEEYRRVLKRRNRSMAAVSAIGLIMIAAALLVQKFLDGERYEYVIGLYTGAGTGLFVTGLLLVFRNWRLLGDEKKLKKSRLLHTDERIEDISNRASRIAGLLLFAAVYAVFLIGGLIAPEQIQSISILLLGMVFLYVLSYVIAFWLYERKM